MGSNSLAEHRLFVGVFSNLQPALTPALQCSSVVAMDVVEDVGDAVAGAYSGATFIYGCNLNLTGMCAQTHASRALSPERRKWGEGWRNGGDKDRGGAWKRRQASFEPPLPVDLFMSHPLMLPCFRTAACRYCGRGELHPCQCQLSLCLWITASG